jgi:alpha-mannosidase
MRTIHLVCNAHIDPTWLWEWQEGAAEAISTFRTAADFCEEYDGFVFNHNEVILYRWVEEYEPQLFKRIQRLVKEGRWHIMGGWFLQPDCNMPSGESFVRQILLGRQYFMEKFGMRPTVAINLDPFGHTRGLVQILARSGYQGYLFCRPGQGDCALEKDEFIWEGYDGSRVLAARASEGYGSGLGKAGDKLAAYIKIHADEPLKAMLWGVGDHGGGPSRRDIETLNGMFSNDPQVKIHHSTPEAFFAELAAFKDQLPVHRKDLNPWGVGCYTSQVRIKQKHRQLENELFATEKMLSSAALQGLLDYPAVELVEANRDLATAEFHDILPGSSIQPVEETSLRLLDHGLEILSRLKVRAFFALAQGQPKAKEGEIPVLVYNPHPYPVNAVVECEFQLIDQNWQDIFTNITVFSGEQALPTQVEKEVSNLRLDWRKRVAFRAELKPSQMNRFDCRLEVLPAKPAPALTETDGVFHFTSAELNVVINARTGLLDRCRIGGVDVLKAQACQAVVIEDNEDPWGMLVHGFNPPDSGRVNTLAGSFTLLTPEESARFSGVRLPSLPPVRVIEDGAVRSVIEAVFGFEQSRLCLRYKLPRQGSEIEVEVRVHWNEKSRMIKLVLPTPDPTARFKGQVAFGLDDLPDNGDEAVAQTWVGAFSEANGTAFTVIDDGTYGCSYSQGQINLTLLRSPAYSGHPIYDRPIVPQDRYTPRIDQGERLYHFWLNGGPLEQRLAQVSREALVHNENPVALSFFPAGVGSLPQPLVILSSETVLLSAAKQAEDGKGLVLRLFEPSGKACATRVSLPWAGMEQEVQLGPFEIRTYKVDPTRHTWEMVNLVEESLEP